jgi:hypothetical protein
MDFTYPDFNFIITIQSIIIIIIIIIIITVSIISVVGHS